MKVLFLLAALMPVLSFAVDAPKVGENGLLRYAKLSGSIEKKVLVNGSYIGASTKVCDISVDVPVYDGNQAGQRVPTIAQCDAEVGGKPYKVQVFGSVHINPAKDGKPARKTLWSNWFIYQPAEGGPNQYLSQVGGASGEVDAQYLSVDLFGTSYENVGLPETFETFAVHLSLDDSAAR